MTSLYQIAGTLIFVMAMGVSVAQAQDQSQPQQPDQTQQPDKQQEAQQPIPAYKSPLASQADNGDTAQRAHAIGSG